MMLVRFLIIEQTFGYNFPMVTSRRRPLTEADLRKIREQWGDDRVVIPYSGKSPAFGNS